MARLIMKIAVALVVVVLIGGMVLLLTLPLLISSDLARTTLSAYASRSLARQVSIERLAFSWGKGFSVAHLAIAGKDQSPLLTLDDLLLVISWKALLGGKIDIVSLDINGINATLSRDKDGNLNIRDLLKPSGEKREEKAGRPSGAGTLPALFLNARIREGAFTFLDERLKTTTRIQGLSADLSLPALDKALSVLLKGDVILNDNPPEQVELSGTAQFAPQGKFDPYRGKGSLDMKAGFGTLKLFFDLAQLDSAEDVKGAELSCSLDLQRLTQLAAGIVGLPPGFSLKGTLTSNLETRGNLTSRVRVDGTTELKNLSVTGGPLQKGSFNQPRLVLSHNINYLPQSSTLEISSLAVNGDFIDLSLTGKVNDLQQKPRGSLRLSGSGRLSEVVLLTRKLFSLPPDLRLSGDVNLSISAEGDVKELAIKGTTDFKDLDLTAAFLNNQPLRARSLKIGHDLGLRMAKGGEGVEAIDVTSLSVKGDFIDLALAGRVSGVQEQPSGTLQLSGKGSLAEIMALTRTLLSLPPDLSLAGDVNLSLAAEGDFKRLGIKGTTSFRDLNLKAAFLGNQPLEEKSLKIVHNLGLSLGGGGKGIDAIDVSELSLKGDSIDLALSGAMHNVLTSPGGKLLLSGSGNLGELAVLAGSLLSLPPDVQLSGDADVSLSAEGEAKGLAVKGTAVFKDLLLNAAFLNHQPFREKALKIVPDVVLTLSDTTRVAVNSLNVQSEMVDATVKGTFAGDATCNLTGKLSARLSLLKKNLQGILPTSFPEDGQLVSDLTIEGNSKKSLAVKGSHSLDGVRMAAGLSEGEGVTRPPTVFAVPKLVLMHDARYAGDQDTLSLGSLQVDSSLGTVRWSGVLSRLSKDLMVNGKGELSLNMEEATRVAKGLVPEDLKAKGRATVTLLSCEGSLNPPAGTPFLASWSGNGSLSAESIDYADIGSIRDLRSTKLALDRGLADASLECALNGGRARVQAQGDFNKTRPDVQVAAEVEGIKVSQDLRMLGYIVPILIIPPDGQLSGNGDFSVQASWQGLDWQSEIGSTIRGKGTLSLRDGNIRSKSVLSVVLKAFQKPDLFPYEQILTNFRLADEKVFNDDILVNGKEFDLNIKGWTSLVFVPAAKGNPLEYSVKGKLLQKAVGGDAGKVLSVLGGGETVLPVAVAGTVQNPTVTVKMPKAEDIFRGLFSPAPKRQ